VSADRAGRALALMRERDLDSLLVTDLLNVRWLTGFTGTNGACVLLPDERVFLTDFRYVAQAEEQVPDFERVTVGRDMVADLARRLRGRAGFDDAHVSVKMHAKLAEKVTDEVELVTASGLVEGLRQVKDAGELQLIAEAAEIATDALRTVLDRGLVGRTERDVALELEQLMRDTGAEGPSFPAIVAAGAHGGRDAPRARAGAAPPRR